MEELNVSEIHFHQEIHDPTVYFKMKGSEEEGKRGRDVEDLKEKAELLQQLQAERSRAENEVRKLQLTASQVTLDISKAQCELASTKVYISELHTETQSLIREVTSLWNDLAKHRLSESYSTSIRMAYQSKMKLYDVEHSNFVSKTISASELRDLQQEIADLEAQLQTLKGQGDVQDLRKQLQELETRHQVVSADREAWSKKIDELTSEKMNVLQSIQQLKKRNHAKLLYLKRQVHEIRSKNARWIEESTYLKKLIADLKQTKEQ